MKKTLIALGILLFSVNCFADENQVTATILEPIEAGKQYIELPTFPSPDREVIEFFSFNCPSCFRFETEFHIPQTIEKNLPEGVKFKKYHLENFGPLAEDLAQAWAVANVLGIQDKVSESLYTAIQKDHKIKTPDDIKAVFATLGIDGETYDKTKNNFLVRAFMTQQTEAIKELQPNSIPAVVVNRKYYINAQGLDQTNNDTIVNDYARVAAFLSQLDPNKSESKSKIN